MRAQRCSGHEDGVQGGVRCANCYVCMYSMKYVCMYRANVHLHLEDGSRKAWLYLLPPESMRGRKIHSRTDRIGVGSVYSLVVT
jgi:hypothetical protein